MPRALEKDSIHRGTTSRVEMLGALHSPYPSDEDSTDAEAPPKMGMLGLLQSSCRLIRRHLSTTTPEQWCTSPPSYETVVSQKQWEDNSRPNSCNVHKFLENLGPRLPPMTARRSEVGVEKRLKDLFASGTTSTLEWARRNPLAIIERVRQFLICCVARECDLEDLLPLSRSDREFFHLLSTTYSWSWLHQIVYGWDKTPPEVQAQAYEVFCLFIENPARWFKLPLPAFLTVLRVFRNVQQLRQGSSLCGPPGTMLFTLQELRSRGQYRTLEEMLRMNNMILDAVVRYKSEGIYLTLKRKLEAERQMSVPPHISSNLWRYVIHDRPEFTEFQKINWTRSSDFAPLRRREDENEESPLPTEQAIRHELEYSPWY